MQRVDFDQLKAIIQAAAPAAVDQWSARAVDERSQQLQVRQGVAQSPIEMSDVGVMISVVKDGGLGYAATSNLSSDGIRRAFSQATALATTVATHSIYDYRLSPAPTNQGRYASVVSNSSETLTLADKLELLMRASKPMQRDPRIVDCSALMATTQTRQLFIGSAGAQTEQHFAFISPNLQATAHIDGVTQTRSLAGQYNGFCQQGGLEVLARSGFHSEGTRIAAEAIELAMAPHCPSGRMDVVLMPDQMMLQIHESIGHPLELDRILGDERNFAGTSFVTLDMFGSYQYGSELLNVTYDPTQPEEFASFAFDDEGTAATKHHIIERGLLKRPLGGAVSQSRARALRPDIGGVATARASSWNRPPIDRMSNLNVEAGNASFDDIVQSIQHGVVMQTNCSWSIDDSRNKFQFGCERAQVVRNGKLAEVVRNPSFRGISATFWRSLAMVGDVSTFQVMGTPYCGKGEPAQIIRVGHAAPACKFADVDVFSSGS